MTKSRAAWRCQVARFTSKPTWWCTCVLNHVGFFFARCSRGLSQLFKDLNMLETIVVVLLILWLVGLVSSYTMGGLIHILLVVALVVIILRVIRGRNPV